MCWCETAQPPLSFLQAGWSSCCPTYTISDKIQDSRKNGCVCVCARACVQACVCTYTISVISKSRQINRIKLNVNILTDTIWLKNAINHGHTLRQQFGNLHVDIINYFDKKQIHMRKAWWSKHTFSPVIANGALNHCSKLAHDLKILGNKKFSSAHSSGNLFCHIHTYIYIQLHRSNTHSVYHIHMISMGVIVCRWLGCDSWDWRRSD